MQVSIPRLRASVFGLTLILFFLPFVTVSCPGAKFTFSGVQLAVGTTVQEPQMFGPPKHRRIDGDPLALAALVCAVVGIAAAFLPAGPSRVLSALAGVGGTVLLLALKSKIDGEVSRQAMGLFEVEYDIGYWGALLGYCAGFLSSFLVKPSRNLAVETESVPPET
jgi:hypothetical protein